MSTIRGNTHRSRVANLEIQPFDNRAEDKLGRIAEEVKQKWQIQGVAIWRRTGKLKVGEIGLVVAVASPHRSEAFKACEYIIDRIKEGDITTEKEIYAD